MGKKGKIKYIKNDNVNSETTWKHRKSKSVSWLTK